MNLLHEEIHLYAIIVARIRTDQGHPVSPDKDDIVTLVGNVVGKVEAIERENKSGGVLVVIL